MIMRKALLPLLLMVALLPAMPLPAAAQSADEIVEKHLAAIGGRDALAKLTTRHATGNVIFAVQGMEFKGTAELFNKAPNKARAVLKLDLSAAGAPEPMQIDQRFDGQAGRALNNLQGNTDISGNQLDNMRNNMFPSSLLNYKANGVKLDVLPKETIDGKELIVLQMTPKAGSTVKMYFDPQTYLLTRTWAKIVSAEQGELEQVITPSDYRKVDGLLLPFKSVNTTPVQVVTITLDKIVHNVPLDDAMFGAPKAPVATPGVR